MKKTTNLFLFFLCLSSIARTQTNTFSFTDSVFNSGTEHTFDFYFGCEGTCSSTPCYKICDSISKQRLKCDAQLICLNKYYYDSIIHILNIDTTLILILEFHSDTYGNKNYSEALTKRYAKGCLHQFIDLGINSSRLECVGMGSSKPIFSHAEVINETDIKKRNEMIEANRRIVIRIK
jgi:hypothetical protein